MADHSATNGAHVLDATADYSPSRNALEQVHAYLVELTGVLEHHPKPELYLPEAQWRLAELNDELAHQHPSAPRVQARWIRFAPVLEEVRPDIPISKLTKLIKKALGVS